MLDASVVVEFLLGEPFNAIGSEVANRLQDPSSKPLGAPAQAKLPSGQTHVIGQLHCDCPGQKSREDGGGGPGDGGQQDPVVTHPGEGIGYSRAAMSAMVASCVACVVTR